MLRTAVFMNGQSSMKACLYYSELELVRLLAMLGTYSIDIMLYRKFFFLQKNSFKGRFLVCVLLELVVHVNSSW